MKKSASLFILGLVASASAQLGSPEHNRLLCRGVDTVARYTVVLLGTNVGLGLKPTDSDKIGFRANSIDVIEHTTLYGYPTVKSLAGQRKFEKKKLISPPSVGAIKEYEYSGSMAFVTRSLSQEDGGPIKDVVDLEFAYQGPNGLTNLRGKFICEGPK